MKVVDPHIHLWDRRQVRYPWLDNPTVAYSGDNRLLPPQHDVAAFLGATGDIEVVRTVHVEANPADPLAEVRWLQQLADDPKNLGHPHGIVAYADLSKPDAPRLLEALAAFRNVRGIRQILNVHADPRFNYVTHDYLRDREWRANLRRLANYGWSFDLQLYPSQMPAALEAVSETEGVIFIINHTGMFVDRGTSSGWRAWWQGLRTLAARKNTALKISGLAMFDHDWTVESFRPYVLEALDSFGTDRTLFASNFPIDGLHSSYQDLWLAYAQIVSGVSSAERNNLFVRNAIRYYRLGEEAANP